ncbi:MAG: TRAP transporter substrate-binding protein DctP, partial [Pseudomonadota bacterium]
KAVEAARPLVADIMAQSFGAKLLAIAPYPPQIVFCKPEVGGLEDLKGLKIRGSGRMTTKLLDALGAEGVNVGFSEVPGALQRGVVDCAITGSGSGYNAGWHEVTTHVMPLPLGGWDPVVTAMNMERWEALDAETQALIEGLIVEQFETAAWDEAAASLAIDLACLTGEGDCPLGPSASMTLVPVTPEDEATARAILVETVLPDWAERAGGDWKDRWNASVGAATGVAIP